MAGSVYSVVGGDMRSAYVALILAEKHRLDVRTAGLELSGVVAPPYIRTLDEALLAADYLILPLPIAGKDGSLFTRYSSAKLDVFSVLSRADARTTVFAGMIPAHIREFAEGRALRVVDYFLSEELQIKNAVPTAEGAVGILMEALPMTLFGSNVAVTGYGRVAEAVCSLLSCMGATVTVYARKRDALARAYCAGHRAKDISRLCDIPPRFDALINTVPARIIDNAALSRFDKSCVLLDLASAPGGFDAEHAKKLGFAVPNGLSLPGRVAPRSAGEYIVDTILGITKEESCLAL